MDELPLGGGRVTPGVVRVGDTVRRPPARPYVRRLLEHLEQRGFDAAPRFLGSDEQGRDVLAFLPGDVPPELAPDHPDDVLTAAAALIRRFHDATVGSELAAGAEVACHNDLSPCNTVFHAGLPAALIDFDDAAPGGRLDDLGYALFLWLNLGTDGPPLAEQTRRIAVFCAGYGVQPDRAVRAAISSAVERTLERLRAAGRRADVEWWQAQRAWLERLR